MLCSYSFSIVVSFNIFAQNCIVILKLLLVLELGSSMLSISAYTHLSNY